MTHSAEMAGVRKVGRWGPGAQSAEPVVISALAEGVLEHQRAGADARPVLSAEYLLPHHLPRVARAHPEVVESRDEVVPPVWCPSIWGMRVSHRCPRHHLVGERLGGRRRKLRPSPISLLCGRPARGVARRRGQWGA